MGCEQHHEDIAAVLGADCSASCKSSNGCTEAGRLAYILTLGVADGFRRRGLARELLSRLIQYCDDSRNSKAASIKAVYLHVVTYNAAAIQLYESMNFTQLAHYKQFYLLHGKPYDSSPTFSRLASQMASVGEGLRVSC